MSKIRATLPILKLVDKPITVLRNRVVLQFSILKWNIQLPSWKHKYS
jgi:hypothetical protein